MSDELKRFMESNGLTRASISILLGVKKRQVDRYRAGHAQIAPPALQIMKILRMIDPRERMDIIEQLINDKKGERNE